MTLLEQAKKSLARYRQWQRDPMTFAAKKNTQQQRHCHCCETDYTGNFCPTCGQKAGDKHITWTSIRQGVMDLWGMGTRSLPYTLWQLIWRPGYLIADYISGKRQISFPPIKMLVFVALFVFLISNWISPDDSYTPSGNEYFALDSFWGWAGKHYDVTLMTVLSLFIPPVFFIFRYAPRCDHHTLPEGFFIQVFIGVQLLMCLLVTTILSVIIQADTFIIAVTIIVAFLVIFRTYRQLFGYGYWGTLWRTSTALIAAVLNFCLFIVFLFIIGCLLKGNYGRAWGNLTSRVPMYLLGSALITYIATFISKRTAHNR